MPEDPPVAGRDDSAAPRRGLGHWVATFGRFWWDFLIGETPEIFVGSVAVLIAAALVAHAGGPSVLAWAGLPLLVVAMLGLSLLRAARRR